MRYSSCHTVRDVDRKSLEEGRCGCLRLTTAYWTIPESMEVCFRVVFGGGGGGVLLGNGGGRCWKNEKKRGGVFKTLLHYMSHERSNSAACTC